MRHIVCAVGEDDQQLPTSSGDGKSISDPEQPEAFRAFRRPPTESDGTLPDSVLQSLRGELDPGAGRCVYSGGDGEAFVVPGPGTLCFISVSARFDIAEGDTTTALAAGGGLGIVHSGTDEPYTVVGVLPAGGHDLQILDRAGRTVNVPPNADDGYWIQVADAVDMFWTMRDGTTRHTAVFSFKRGS